MFIVFIRRIYFVSVLGHGSYSGVGLLSEQTALKPELPHLSAITNQVSALKHLILGRCFRVLPCKCTIQMHSRAFGQGLKIYVNLLGDPSCTLNPISLIVCPANSCCLSSLELCPFWFIETDLYLGSTFLPQKEYAFRKKTKVIVELILCVPLLSRIIVLCCLFFIA